ncbi:MAG: BrnT family toxin [Sulfuricella sp.]
MDYTCRMNFEWDEAKSEACFIQRGFDFAYAARAFFDPNRIVHADTRHSYGEERYQLMGMIEQRLFVVVYTPRHDTMRIISVRKANQREVRHYEDSTRDD